MVDWTANRNWWTLPIVGTFDRELLSNVGIVGIVTTSKLVSVTTVSAVQTAGLLEISITRARNPNRQCHVYGIGGSVARTRIVCDPSNNGTGAL